MEGENRLGLEAKVVLVFLSDLTDEALERRLADEEVSRLLVLADLTQSDRAYIICLTTNKMNGICCKFEKCSVV